NPGTCKEVADKIKEDYSIKYSVEGVRVLLKRHGLTFSRPKTVGGEKSGIVVVTVKNIRNGSLLRLSVIRIKVLRIMWPYSLISVIEKKRKRFFVIRPCMIR
ncbi:MAG: winged helix-turn-helix domain-containing protein, partial [Candidatus Electrothrix sp. EH2]|nr:winged helix-turn-helix domain-containing protein [Candidatus Electrothrix sp. EH2]